MVEATFAALVWPTGQQRTARPIAGRGRARARAGIADVLKAIDLLEEVTSLPTSEIVLSFGQDRDRTRMSDGGAAAWFVWGDARRCVACDLYAALVDNLFAIGQLIRGCAAEYGRGSTAAVRHALESHTPRLSEPPSPPPEPLASQASEHWTTLLGLAHDASPSAITTAFRRLALQKHPDKGGTRQDWDRLMSAYEQAHRSAPAQKSVSNEWKIAEFVREDAVWFSSFPDLTSDTPLDDVFEDDPTT